MRRLDVCIALCAVMFACARLPSPAAAQSGEPGEYVPPSASKSVEIGNFYLRRKDYRGALGRFLEATKTDPMYAPAYLGLGKVYEKMRQRRKALEAYQKYLDALPSEKQAEEAKEVHKAIRRLERELKRSEVASSSANYSVPTHH